MNFYATTENEIRERAIEAAAEAQFWAEHNYFPEWVDEMVDQEEGK